MQASERPHGYDGSAPAVDCQPRSKVGCHKCRLRPTGARVFTQSARVSAAAHTRAPERQPWCPREMTKQARDDGAAADDLAADHASPGSDLSSMTYNVKITGARGPVRAQRADALGRPC